MYVVTFYSFKGGVGRTLALMNVAAQLVRSGKTVLVVDFDLEAPGLDSFPSIACESDVDGIVEFVSEYLETNISPPVRRFVSECKLSAFGRGRLFLMRSGRRNSSYSVRLSTIDWQRLYTERDGYLLFEDLRAQWEQEFRPDYVLVDSRTGHTDVGGICTRQLPNAVVACFIPNEENIAGLETIVADIRREAETPARRDIRIYFVPSNVPSLDDEQRILARRIREAKKRLKCDAPACIIHRYESLSLLDNVIFVNERRRTRLAREYRELTSIIAQDNIQDRDAILRALRTDRFVFLAAQSRRSLQGRLDAIRAVHAKDGEVLHEVGKLLRRLGREEDAQALVRESEVLGFRSASTVLDLAFGELSAGQREAAFTRMIEALELPNADYYDISRAIQLCVRADSTFLSRVVESTSFRRLPKFEKRSLCDEMLVDRQAGAVAERVLEELPAGSTERTSLMLALIAQGKFEAAMAVVGRTRPEPSTLDTAEAFNFAMAEWGATHRAPVDYFRSVLQDVESERGLSGKNICQAFAIAAWAVGEQQKATRFWEKALELASSDRAATFSAWRYLQVPGEQFRGDLQQVKRMIEGDETLPPVLVENWAQCR
jgi:hypothetical protein